MTPHNEAAKDDYADVVLMPGDPLRAKYIADKFLSDVKQVNRVRNCFGFTGTYKNHPVSVQAGGMGQPSNAIYIHELYSVYNVKCIVRVGTAGAISKQVKLGDVCVALTASSDNAMNSGMFGAYTYSPVVSHNWLAELTRNLSETKVGGFVSSDWFYHPNAEWWKPFQNYGTLAVDMETYVLYSLANKFNKEAMTVCTISDHLDQSVGKEIMTPTEREQGLDKMLQATLDTVVAMA